MSGNQSFQNAYTVGKGRLFFNLFVSDDNRTPVSGYKYFGNTPSFESERKVTTLDHYDSDAGQKVKDDSIDIQTEFAGKFTCDNITGNNLALFFGGTANEITQVGGTVALTQTITVEPDTYYQFGATASNPTGNAATGTISITGPGTTIVAADGSQYNYDPVSGLLYATPAVTPGAVWTLAAELAAASLETVVEAGLSIFGQLMFISNNPKGPQRDIIVPYCKLSSEGAMPLKGDTWMTLGFTWEALQLNPQTRRVYVRERPVSIIDPNGP